MDAQFWSVVLPWATIVFSVLALASTGGSIVARDKVAAQKNEEIKRLKPRSLSDFQKKTLAEHLRGTLGNVGLVTPLMDGEALDYAEEIAAVFRNSGWTVAPTNQQSLNTFSGYSVLATSNGLPSTGLDVAAAALKAAEIPWRKEPIREGSVGGVFNPDTLYIIVGRKP